MELVAGIAVGLIGLSGLAVAVGRRGAAPARRRSTLVRDVQPGNPASLVGAVVTDRALQSPFSKQPCVYFAYQLERAVPHGKSQRWEVVSQDQQSIPFWLRDDTGQISIYPDGAEFRDLPVGTWPIATEEIAESPFYAHIRQVVAGYVVRARERLLPVAVAVAIVGPVARGRYGLAVLNGQGPFTIQPAEGEVRRSAGTTAWWISGALLLALGAGLILSSVLR